MTKLDFLEKIEIIVNSFITSLVASFLRLLFHRSGSFIQACLIFFGGIILGTFVGYLIDDIESLKSFSKILVAASALAGKEVVEFVIKDGPNLIKKLITKRIGVSEESSDDTPTDK
jgi:hypothetical protein